MTCHECLHEFPGVRDHCPSCGRPLSVSPATPTEPPAPPPVVADSSPWSSTLSVSGAGSVRAHLRPRTVSEIFSEAFWLFGQHWKALCLVVLVLYAPVAGATLGLQRALERYFALGRSGSALAGWAAAYVGASVVAYFLSVFVVTQMVSDAYLGHPVTLGQCVRLSGRLWGYTGATLLCMLAQVGLMVIVALPFLAGLLSMSGGLYASPASEITRLFLALVAGMVALLAGVLLWWRLLVVAPVAVVEGTPPLEALRRGNLLVKGFYWKAVGLMLVATAIAIGTTVAFTVLAGVLGMGIAASGVFGASVITVSQIQGAVLGLVGNAVSMPLILIPIVLFYYDLRIRKEAFDLQVLAEQLGYGVTEQA